MGNISISSSYTIGGKKYLKFYYLNIKLYMNPTTRNTIIASSLNTNRLVFVLIGRISNRRISLSISELLEIVRPDIRQRIIDSLLIQNNNTDDSDSDSHLN